MFDGQSPLKLSVETYPCIRTASHVSTRAYDQGSSSDGKTPETGPVIKEEKLTDEVKMQARVAAFIASPSVPFKRATQMQLETKEMYIQAKGNDLASSFSEKVDIHSKEIAKALAVLDKMVMGAKAKDNKIPMLIRHMDSLEERHSQLVEFATKIGVNIKTGGQSKKKRRTA